MGRLVGHDRRSEASCDVARLGDVLVALCGETIGWITGVDVW